MDQQPPAEDDLAAAETASEDDRGFIAALILIALLWAVTSMA